MGWILGTGCKDWDRIPITPRMDNVVCIVEKEQ